MKRLLLAIMTALLSSWGEKEHTYLWEDVRLFMIDEGEHAFFGIQDDSIRRQSSPNPTKSFC